MLLELKDFTCRIRTERGPVTILDRISLTIAEGETVALVGESGSGKSVTALSILRLLEAVAPVETEGEIWFEGRNLLTLAGEELRRMRGNRIAMIFQEPMTSLNPVYTIAAQLIEPLILHRGLHPREARRKGLELLERTGIADPAGKIDSYPHQFSGGQRQRIMIAMALACRPTLLIADEPTTALDVTIQAQILALLKEIQAEMEMAVLLITHDLNMVKKIADRVQIMYQGRIVEEGETRRIFTAPRDPYTIALLESVPKGAPTGRAEATEVLLEARQFCCHFPVRRGFLQKQVGTIKAVDEVNLTIRRGTTFGIVGESGSGKTTLGLGLLRLVAGRGSVRYQGRELLGLSNRQLRPLRRDLQVVFQDPFSSLSPRLSVAEIIGEGLLVHKLGRDSAERRRMVAEILQEVGLEAEMADRFPHEFSGGQRQRIAIARAVILKPGFILLDEPTSALDMTIQAQIVQLLRTLQERHALTYLFISHDLRVVRSLADELAVMHQGRIVESGPAAEIFAQPHHPYTQELFKAAFLEKIW